MLLIKRKAAPASCEISAAAIRIKALEICHVKIGSMAEMYAYIIVASRRNDRRYYYGIVVFCGDYGAPMLGEGVCRVLNVASATTATR